MSHDLLVHLVTVAELPGPALLALLAGVGLGCPDCRYQVERYLAATGGEALLPADGDLAGELARLETALEGGSAYRIDAYLVAIAEAVERLAGREDFDAAARAEWLLALPSHGRHAAVATDPDLWRHDFADELLSRALAAPAASGKADELARLALAVAQRIPLAAAPRGLILDLEAMAWACLGGERAQRGERAASALALERAERLAAGGTGDPLVAIEIHKARAAFFHHSGAGERSLEAWRQVRRLAHRAGERSLEQEVLWKIAELEEERGNLAGAHSALGQLLSLAAVGADAESLGRAIAALKRLSGGSEPTAEPAPVGRPN